MDAELFIAWKLLICNRVKTRRGCLFADFDSFDTIYVGT